MLEKRFIRLIKIFLLCILAAVANNLVNHLCVYVLRIPLFLDTIFNAAVCFSVGLIPGIITALVTYIGITLRYSNSTPFVLCSIVEVLLIWRFNPDRSVGPKEAYLPKAAVTSFVSVLARLIVLYIVCSLAISVLGGVIEYIYYTILPNSKLYFTAEDAIKLGLLRNDIPALALNILSRIPVNIVDRFIVIFGGYFLARGIRQVVMKKNEKR